MSETFIAEEAVLARHGAHRRGDALLYGDFSFEATHGVIFNERERVQLSKSIREAFRFDAEDAESESIVAGGRSIHVPPMIFKNRLSIRARGVELHLNAADSMLAWAAQHQPSEVQQLRVVKVPHSKRWSTLKGVTPDMHSNEWDWCFLSDYLCSLASAQGGGFSRAKTLSASGGDSRWTPYTGPSKINTSVLARKDDILFFDEMTLYQDDLEDCGEVEFTVKVRVMPLCWFVLCRLYMRIDGGEVVLRETRLFYPFADNEARQVHMEVLWKEGNAGDAGFGALSAAQYRDPNYMSQVLPVVNDTYGIHKQYSCALV